MGELGMSGYSNANYWGKASYARRDARLMAKIRCAIETELLLLRDHDDEDSVPLLNDTTLQLARDWYHEWIVDELSDLDDWEPRALNVLCKSIEANPNDDPLAEFCSHACRIESRVIIQYCLEKGGYDV